MDWNKIKEKYTKAHKSLIEWMGDNYCDIDFEFVNDSWKGALIEPYTWKDRDLFDFFDELNINVQISVKCDLKDNRWYIPYVWLLSDTTDIEFESCQTRLVAEEEGFLKAFELLENQIK
jgi:hypothetical protein